MNSKLTEFSGGAPVVDTCSVPSEFEVLIKEIMAKHLVLVAERKHGKSTSLKTFIEYVKRTLGDKVLIKIFDVSQSWFHCAPVDHRQYVTPGSKPVNIGDCVYEMGELSKDGRRAFVGSVLALDYRGRQLLKKAGGEAAIKRAPLILYVFEEANCYFDSYSLRKADEYSSILNDFVSVGRNYGLGGVLVVTRMVGELATGIRERSNLLLGRVTGSGEIYSLRRLTSKAFVEGVKSVARFHWFYWNGEGLGPFRIRDLVRGVPADFVVAVEPEEQKPTGPGKIIAWVAFVVFVFVMLILSLLGR